MRGKAIPKKCRSQTPEAEVFVTVVDRNGKEIENDPLHEKKLSELRLVGAKENDKGESDKDTQRKGLEVEEWTRRLLEKNQVEICAVNQHTRLDHPVENMVITPEINSIISYNKGHSPTYFHQNVNHKKPHIEELPDYFQNYSGVKDNLESYATPAVMSSGHHPNNILMHQFNQIKCPPYCIPAVKDPILSLEESRKFQERMAQVSNRYIDVSHSSNTKTNIPKPRGRPPKRQLSDIVQPPAINRTTRPTPTPAKRKYTRQAKSPVDVQINANSSQTNHSMGGMGLEYQWNNIHHWYKLPNEISQQSATNANTRMKPSTTMPLRDSFSLSPYNMRINNSAVVLSNPENQVFENARQRTNQKQQSMFDQHRKLSHPASSKTWVPPQMLNSFNPAMSMNSLINSNNALITAKQLQSLNHYAEVQGHHNHKSTALTNIHPYPSSVYSQQLAAAYLPLDTSYHRYPSGLQQPKQSVITKQHERWGPPDYVVKSSNPSQTLSSIQTTSNEPLLLNLAVSANTVNTLEKQNELNHPHSIPQLLRRTSSVSDVLKTQTKNNSLEHQPIVKPISAVIVSNSESEDDSTKISNITHTLKMLGHADNVFSSSHENSIKGHPPQMVMSELLLTLNELGYFDLAIKLNLAPNVQIKPSNNLILTSPVISSSTDIVPCQMEISKSPLLEDLGKSEKTVLSQCARDQSELLKQTNGNALLEIALTKDNDVTETTQLKPKKPYFLGNIISSLENSETQDNSNPLENIDELDESTDFLETFQNLDTTDSADSIFSAFEESESPHLPNAISKRLGSTETLSELHDVSETLENLEKQSSITITTPLEPTARVTLSQVRSMTDSENLSDTLKTFEILNCTDAGTDQLESSSQLETCSQENSKNGNQCVNPLTVLEQYNTSCDLENPPPSNVSDIISRPLESSNRGNDPNDIVEALAELDVGLFYSQGRTSKCSSKTEALHQADASTKTSDTSVAVVLEKTTPSALHRCTEDSNISTTMEQLGTPLINSPQVLDCLPYDFRKNRRQFLKKLQEKFNELKLEQCLSFDFFLISDSDGKQEIEKVVEHNQYIASLLFFRNKTILRRITENIIPSELTLPSKFTHYFVSLVDIQMADMPMKENLEFFPLFNNLFYRDLCEYMCQFDIEGVSFLQNIFARGNNSSNRIYSDQMIPNSIFLNNLCLNNFKGIDNPAEMAPKTEEQSLGSKDLSTGKSKPSKDETQVIITTNAKTFDSVNCDCEITHKDDNLSSSDEPKEKRFKCGQRACNNPKQASLSIDNQLKTLNAGVSIENNQIHTIVPEVNSLHSETLNSGVKAMIVALSPEIVTHEVSTQTEVISPEEESAETKMEAEYITPNSPAPTENIEKLVAEQGTSTDDLILGKNNIPRTFYLKSAKRSSNDIIRMRTDNKTYKAWKEEWMTAHWGNHKISDDSCTFRVSLERFLNSSVTGSLYKDKIIQIFNADPPMKRSWLFDDVPICSEAASTGVHCVTVDSPGLTHPVDATHSVNPANPVPPVAPIECIVLSD